jgi:hypothetical protein
MNNDWIIWNGGECPVPGKRDFDKSRQPEWGEL